MSFAVESFSMGGVLRICCNSQREDIREIRGRDAHKPASRKQNHAMTMQNL